VSISEKSNVKSNRKNVRRTLSTRAGLQFNVKHIKDRLKKITNMRTMKRAAVYLAAVIEYLVDEVLDLSIIAIDELDRPRPNRIRRIIKPKHIDIAKRKDQELNEFLKNVDLPCVTRLPV